MSESETKISEQVEILQTKYDELLKFKHDNTCSDCGVAVGINPGERRTCTECNAIFCPKYNKGGYSYGGKYTRYTCRECYKLLNRSMTTEHVFKCLGCANLFDFRGFILCAKCSNGYCKKCSNETISGLSVPKCEKCNVIWCCYDHKTCTC